MWAPHPAALTTTDVHVSRLERGDRGAGERAGSLGLAGVRVERAAAALGPRHPHLNPWPREAPDRGLVVRAEHRVLHAALQEPDPAAQRPRAGITSGKARPAPGRRSGGRSASDARGSPGRAAARRSPGRARWSPLRW